MNNINMPLRQAGFTLLELMVALTLGLIISAVALQLALTGQKGVSHQQAQSNLQSDALFGMEALIREVRLANLNSGQPIINNNVLHGGIVLEPKNYSSLYKKGTDGKETNDINITLIGNTLSTGAIDNSSNLAGQKSDQLVIQYRNIVNNQFDCEGREIPQDVFVVQKYFVQAIGGSDEPEHSYALACKAFFYVGDEPEKIDLSETSATVLIPRVEHFSVLLGVANDQCSSGDVIDKVMSCFGYISVDDYQRLSTIAKPQIVSIQLGVLVRSTQSIGNSHLFNALKEYQVLHTVGKLNKDDKNQKYMRSVVTQTVALRNGFGVEE